MSYGQRLGRGTRRLPPKEASYVIDVVYQHGTFGTFSNRTRSLKASFGMSVYRPFGDLFKTGAENDELIILDILHKTAIKLNPFDIFTFEKHYDDYPSVEQIARELFVSISKILLLSGKSQKKIFQY